MNNKKITSGLVLSIMFYIAAVLMLLYFMWAFMTLYDEFQVLFKSGQTDMTWNGFKAISIYMQGSGIYFVYSLLLFGVGDIIRRVSNPVKKEVRIEIEKEN